MPSTRRTLTAIVTALALIGAVSPGTGAAAEKKKKPAVTYSGKFALRFVYDDNIIHYSDEDLYVFANEPTYGKFAIDQAGDWIIRPRIEFKAASGRGWGGEKMEGLVRLSSWRYASGSVKNNESIQILLKHGAWGVSNFQFSFYHAPEAYIRNFNQRPPFMPRSTTDMVQTPFNYTSTSVDLAYWRKWTKRLSGKLLVKRSWRYFNREFMTNDNWEWRLGGYLAWKTYAWLTITGEYLYSDVPARGANEVGETLENSNDGDPSYERDSYKVTFGFRLPKKNRIRISSVSVKAQYQEFYFTSEMPAHEDPLHTGRKDKVYRLELTGATPALFGPASLEGGYRYTERTSSAAADIAEDSGIGEEKDYTDNRFWIGVEYPF